MAEEGEDEENKHLRTPTTNEEDEEEENKRLRRGTSWHGARGGFLEIILISHPMATDLLDLDTRPSAQR